MESLFIHITRPYAQDEAVIKWFVQKSINGIVFSTDVYVTFHIKPKFENGTATFSFVNHETAPKIIQN